MEAQGRRREVRNVYIIYFISRKGRIDHPHLLRVHHFCGNGVRLRDIKRWLSVVRGEDMPESYSWSFKRRYKTGYVWQDSVDEDLITPISDNEYVIKGSEFYSVTSDSDGRSVGIYGHEELSNVETNKINDQNSEATQTDDEAKQLIDIHEDPVATNHEETKHLISRNDTTKKKRNDERFCLNILKKYKNTKMSDSSASKHKCSPKKNKSGNFFKNMITCGMVNTKDSAIKPMRQQRVY